jgi:hypothetical protein
MSGIVVERAISLTQPWATLMALDAKRVETRCWNTNYRGWVAIHSAKSFPMECQRLCYRMPFARALTECNTSDDLPLGQILAVTEIYDCQPTNLHGRYCMLHDERDFGDYSPGRYMIFTRGVRRLKQPILIRGALSIWRLQRPITEADLA